MATAVNARSITSVPMLRKGRAIGAINVAGSRPGFFSARQITFLQTFADQAVIAVENVRLFDEVRDTAPRNLAKHCEQQTATADVLKVISRSAFHLPTVFDTLVESAVKLCGASYGGIFMRHGDVLRAGATRGVGRTGIDVVMVPADRAGSQDDFRSKCLLVRPGRAYPRRPGGSGVRPAGPATVSWNASPHRGAPR